MSAINDEMTFVSRDCKSILDICDKICQASLTLLDGENTKLLESSQLSSHIRVKDHDSEVYAAARLQDAPVIARVSCKDDSNRTRIFYTCLCSPPSGIPRANLNSIYSPLGRLAVLPLGAKLVTPKGETLVVTDRVALRPVDYRQTRDIHDTLFESSQRDRIRVKSLRDFLRTFGESRPKLAVEADDEPPLVPAEELDVVVDEGEIRPQSVGLALNQPYLLDQVQDGILRRPFQTRQFIIGPPGSGKTTTLIKRLDFMISTEALEAEQTGLSAKLTGKNQAPHPASWYYFLPTDALRQYIKDSFTKLVIPGFEKNALTWEEARIDLATNYFRILASDSYQGLSLSKTLGRVSKSAINDTVAWYTDFSAYQAKAFFQKLKARAKYLAERDDEEIAHLGKQLLDLLDKSSDHTLAWFKKALDPFQETIANLLSAKTETLERELKSAFQSHAERDPGLVEGLVSLMSGAERAKKIEASSNSGKLFRREALRIYSSALLDHAVSLATGRNLSRDSRSGRVLGWLGEGRLLPQSRLQELGYDQIVCRALNSFKVDNPVFYNAYFNTIISNYLLFRRRNHLWYTKALGSSRQVEPLEVDLLLLAFLEPGSEILKNFDSSDDKVRYNWSLDSQHYLTRNQVIIDGASDFSPIQLKCMTSLVNAELGSVTAAADLQLRTTEWGLRSLDDLEWAMPKVVLTELQSNYRQSQQLLELSDLLSGASQNRFSVSRFDSKGLKPTLGQKCGSLTETAKWLSERVSEIVHRAGRLPSTGVAVLKPSEVAPLTEALSRVLASQDLKARAFTPGQPLGFSNDIRVLTLDEARGLEFEAFFLVSQEDLSRSQPDLYNRLLYLASSRAITYLGFIFRETLPSNLDNLTRLTVPDWSQPHETFATLSL